MAGTQAHRVDFVCNGCGQRGCISWKETPNGKKNSEPKIHAVEVVGFYQQVGVPIPAIFCSKCGTMKVPFA